MAKATESKRRGRRRFVALLCVGACMQHTVYSHENAPPVLSSLEFETFLQSKQIPVRTKEPSSPSVAGHSDLQQSADRSQLTLALPSPNDRLPETDFDKQTKPPESPPIQPSPTREPVPAVVSLQPAVENYVPPEEDELLPEEWRGCWWEQPHALRRQLITRSLERVQQVDLEQLVWWSVQYSPAIKSILKVPKIQRADEDVARGEFDPRLHVRSNFRDSSDPVGNTLTTGGPNRLNEYFWENAVGITDRNTFGGRTELKQAIDARDSNSLFFKPSDQVDSRLTLNYTQPLKRGAGRFYNTSQIQIQQAKTQQEIAVANERLQNHAMDIYTAYWSLVLSRFHFVQSLNTKDRLQQIRKMLVDRQGIDLLETHIQRCDNEIEKINSSLVTLKANMRAFQLELARLVAAPEIQSESCSEIIPLTTPTLDLPPADLILDEYFNALLYRGDLAKTRFKIEQIAIQKRVAVHELQSRLDLVAESYVRGLAGEKMLGRSFIRQFDTGTPTYAFGAVYERPYANRAAKANVQSNTHSLDQLAFEYEDQLRHAQARLNIAVEKSKGSYRAVFASVSAVKSAVTEVELQQTRLGDYWAENTSRSVILTEWLDAEMRLFIAERELAERQIEYMRYLAQIKLESGTLLALQAD